MGPPHKGDAWVMRRRETRSLPLQIRKLQCGTTSASDIEAHAFTQDVMLRRILPTMGLIAGLVSAGAAHAQTSDAGGAVLARVTIPQDVRANRQPLAAGKYDVRLTDEWAEPLSEGATQGTWHPAPGASRVDTLKSSRRLPSNASTPKRRTYAACFRERHPLSRQIAGDPLMRGARRVPGCIARDGMWQNQ